MIYLLDTSFLIEHFRHHGPAEKFIRDHLGETLYTSAVCEAELSEGIYREKPEKISEKLKEKEEMFKTFAGVVPFDREQADIAGRIRADLSKKGSLIGDLDILIAAATMACEATLVTQNPRHFAQISGLLIKTI